MLPMMFFISCRSWVRRRSLNIYYCYYKSRLMHNHGIMWPQWMFLKPTLANWTVLNTKWCTNCTLYSGAMMLDDCDHCEVLQTFTSRNVLITNAGPMVRDECDHFRLFYNKYLTIWPFLRHSLPICPSQSRKHWITGILITHVALTAPCV